MRYVKHIIRNHPVQNLWPVNLFFFDQSTDPTVTGYMPLSGQFGYIIGYHAASEAAYNRTTAHEIAHVREAMQVQASGAAAASSRTIPTFVGRAFNLRHTFSNENSHYQLKGSTGNLLDYAAPTATGLYKYQWDLMHDPESIWFAWMEEEEEGEVKEKYNYSFVINGKRFNSGRTFVTLYTDKELEIKIECSDTSYRYNKIKWQIEGETITSKDDNANKISIKVNNDVLTKEKNRLVVKDSLNDKIAELIIQTYYPPYIEFERPIDYRGEYLFDKGYEFERLANPEYYDTIHVGKDKKIYYAPVIGLDKGQTSEIRVIIKDFPSIAIEDENFRVVIKASHNGFIRINGLSDSVVLNALQFSTLNSIAIHAREYLDTIPKLYIYAYIPSINRKIGLIEYYCRAKEERNVHLIYVKFKDDTNYPDYLNYRELQDYLNTYAMNQLFLNIVVDTVHLNSSYCKKDFDGKSKEYILQLLKNEKYGFIDIFEVGGIKNDYYFITNLDREDLGGFHRVGEAGGLQTKWKGSAVGETPEEITAHELGHWQGLPHTFRVYSVTHKEQDIPSQFIWVTNNEKGTKDNFMDYEVRRKTWFKFQLLKLKK